MKSSNPTLSLKYQKDQLKKERTQFLLSLLNDGEASERLLEWGGRLALENESWSIAESIFASLLERRRNSEDLAGLGQALLQQNRLEEAEECLLDALNYIMEPCPLLFIVQKNLGYICLLNHNFEMAEEYFNKAYTLNPQSSSLQFQRAYLHLKQGEYKAAESGFKNLLQNQPNNSKAWLGLALSRRAMNKWKLAEACLFQCLDLDSQNKQALQLRDQWAKTNSDLIASEFAFAS